MSSRARLEIIVHRSIGHIRIQGILHCCCRLFYLSVFGTETISSDEGSIYIRTHFSYFRLSRICGNIH